LSCSGLAAGSSVQEIYAPGVRSDGFSVAEKPPYQAPRACRRAISTTSRPACVEIASAEADDFGEAFTPEPREQEERLRAQVAAQAKPK